MSSYTLKPVEQLWIGCRLRTATFAPLQITSLERQGNYVTIALVDRNGRTRRDTYERGTELWTEMVSIGGRLVPCTDPLGGRKQLPAVTAAINPTKGAARRGRPFFDHLTPKPSEERINV